MPTDERGRPIKLTPEVQKTICDALLRYPVHLACEMAGVGEKTYHRWRERGRVGEEPFLTFLTATQEAIARSETSLLDILWNAAPKDPVRAQWLLERRWPEHYGRQRVELANPEGETFKTCEKVNEDLHKLLSAPAIRHALVAVEGQLALERATQSAEAGPAGLDNATERVATRA